ncbi:MAG: transglutaminase family protein [Planctomycetota bacterium]
MSVDELGRQDIALLNLRCAEGLPGSEDLDIEKCLATLDQWAAKVKLDTDRHLYRYQQDPAAYENSEGYYRMMMLVTVVQQDFGVHYNPERIREVDFTKSKDLFLHGMIGDDNGGTCVSMPVLYTAVARRLGYPVHLVTANSHVFCRWDDLSSAQGGDRFNIEATNQGMNSFNDEYYMTWPKPITKAQVEKGWFLKSLNNAESLATFLAARGHCLEDSGDIAKARVAYAMAAEKNPSVPIYRGFLAQTMGLTRRVASQSKRRPGPALPPTATPTSARSPRPWEPVTTQSLTHNVLKPNAPFSSVPSPSFRAPPGFPSPSNAGFGPPPR